MTAAASIHRIPVSSSLLIARLNADMISTFPSRSALVPFRISLSFLPTLSFRFSKQGDILQRSRHPSSAVGALPIPDRERIDFMLDSKMLINGCCHLPEHRLLPHADRQTGGATVMRLGRSATVVHCSVSFISARLRRRGEEQGKGCPYPPSLPPIEIDLMFLSGFVNPGTAALIREVCAARPTHSWLGGRNSECIGLG